VSGRRLSPNPAATPPVTELVDPSLAEPQGFVEAPPISPELKAAQEQLAAAAMGISVEELQKMKLGQDAEPFATFHEEEGAAPTEEQVTELTPEERAEFGMLMSVGRRSKSIDVYGHKVDIESLTVGDDCKIGLFCKEYRDAPPADSRSFQIAVCACAIRSVDNRPLYTALSEDEDVFAAKVNKLMTWYPPVITEVYRAVLDLDREFGELAEKLKKSKGSAPSTS
jgi:hypothetical protein